LSQIQGIQKSGTLYRRIIPPEITNGDRYSKKSDVFMYGLILVELLTSKKVESSTVEFISSLRQCESFRDCPGRDLFIDLIEKCCSQDPQYRPLFQSYNERDNILDSFEKIQELYFHQVREEQLQALPQQKIKGGYIE